MARGRGSLDRRVVVVKCLDLTISAGRQLVYIETGAKSRVSTTREQALLALGLGFDDPPTSTCTPL